MFNISREARFFGMDLSLLKDKLGFLPKKNSTMAGEFYSTLFESEIQLYNIEKGDWCYYKGRFLDKKENNPEYKGILLPESYFLKHEIVFPASFKGDIESVVPFQVSSVSPFQEDNTVYGYRLDRDEQSYLLKIVVASRKCVEDVVENSSVAFDENEVWAQLGDCAIHFSSLGMTKRLLDFRKRRSIVTRLLAIIFILLLVIPLLPVAAEVNETKKLKAEVRYYQVETSDVIDARSQLLKINSIKESANDYVASQWVPLEQLSFLTDHMNDNAWLASFDYNVERLKIDGYSQDAAKLMADLSASEKYEDVRSMTSMLRDAKGNERFSFELQLNGGGYVEEE